MKPWHRKTLWVALIVCWVAVTVGLVGSTAACSTYVKGALGNQPYFAQVWVQTHVMLGGVALILCVRKFFTRLLYGERVIVLPIPFPIPVVRPVDGKPSDN